MHSHKFGQAEEFSEDFIFLGSLYWGSTVHLFFYEVHVTSVCVNINSITNIQTRVPEE